MDLINFHSNVFNYIALTIYFIFLLIALYQAPWRIIKQKDSSNILFATCAVIFLVWNLKVQVETGLALHLLGSTLLTLMFRWQVAILANGLILLGITIFSDTAFQAFGINGLVMGVLPIMISHFIWRFNERFLPPNYFIYIFVAAFLGAGISMLSVGVVSYHVLQLAEMPLNAEILDQYLWLYVAIMYPEAFVTGGAMSIFVLYKPHWIASYDDNRYMRNR